jgi:hypothetical protein
MLRKGVLPSVALTTALLMLCLRWAEGGRAGGYDFELGAGESTLVGHQISYKDKVAVFEALQRFPAQRSEIQVVDMHSDHTSTIRRIASDVHWSASRWIGWLQPEED